MSQASPTEPAPAPSTSKSKPPRYWLILLFTAACAFVGMIAAGAAVAAVLSFLPPVVALILGLSIASLFPLILAFRAHKALKRRGTHVLLRRFVNFFLLVGTQVAIGGAILTYTETGTGHLAKALATTMADLGGVAVVQPMLEKYATSEGVFIDDKGKPKPTVDAGVTPSDAGVDAGSSVTKNVDASVPATALDASVVVDASVAVAQDAGVLAPLAVDAAWPDMLVAPTGNAATPLSARANGKPVRTVCFSATTSTDEEVILVGTVQSGGRVLWRSVSLKSVEDKGSPSAVSCAEDGTVAVVLGAVHVAIARPDRTSVEVLKALAPLAKIQGDTVRAVRDVAVGPKANLVAVVELDANVDAGTAVRAALVTYQSAKSTVTVVRKAGDVVPLASEATVALSFALKQSRGQGVVIASETFVVDGNDVVTQLTGTTYAMNPQRLLQVRLDQSAPLELVRTGAVPLNSEPSVHLQAFADVVSIVDGRIFFDANHVEASAAGWLYELKGGQLRALTTPALSKGYLRDHAPRTKFLDADADSNIVFERADHSIIAFNTAHPEQALAGVKNAVAVRANKSLAKITSSSAPLVTNGGEFVLARASLDGAKDAVVISSKDDLKNGRTEILVEVGVPVVLSQGGEITLKNLRAGFYDELLWQ